MTARPRLCIDGPWRLVTHSTRHDTSWQAVDHRADHVECTVDGVRQWKLPMVAYSPATVAVAGRVYRIWTCEHAPPRFHDDDLTAAAIRALIDADPLAAEACRITTDRTQSPLLSPK